MVFTSPYTCGLILVTVHHIVIAKLTRESRVPGEVGVRELLLASHWILHICCHDTTKQEKSVRSFEKNPHGDALQCHDGCNVQSPDSLRSLCEKYSCF